MRISAVGDVNSVQAKGVRLRTPCACIYAVVTGVGVHGSIGVAAAPPGACALSVPFKISVPTPSFMHDKWLLSYFISAVNFSRTHFSTFSTNFCTKFCFFSIKFCIKFRISAARVRRFDRKLECDTIVAGLLCNVYSVVPPSPPPTQQVSFFFLVVQFWCICVSTLPVHFARVYRSMCKIPALLTDKWQIFEQVRPFCETWMPADIDHSVWR